MQAGNYEMNRVLEAASECLESEALSVVKEYESIAVVQAEDKPGYALISIVDDNHRLLAYSPAGEWDEGDLPPALKEWVESKVISTRIVRPDLPSTDDKKETRQDVEPLLTSHWHQNSPYNDLAPVIADGNVKTVAGCVAIAASQIVYYWRKDNPEFTLADTPVYPYGKAPVTYSVPKGSPNNWDLMQDSYTSTDSPEAREAAAQLCYVLGTTSYLDYGGSTGGQIKESATAMLKQYRIKSSYAVKNLIDQEEWDILLYEELKNCRPVLYAGNAGKGNGHAFVVDGYDARTGMFHINFGWGGRDDGYYVIDDTPESVGGYYQNQDIVYNIHPEKLNIEAALSLETSEFEGRVDLIIEIVNNSTLDLSGLKLFILDEGETLGEEHSPVWETHARIRNNGQDLRIRIKDIFNMVSGETSHAVLTDHNNYVLDTFDLNSPGGIGQLFDGEDSAEVRIYDLSGKLIKNPSKGIYIIRKGNECKKLIIR